MISEFFLTDTFLTSNGVIDFIISSSSSYVFLFNCILCDVSLATKSLILLAAPLLTKTNESSIKIPSGKQCASGLKAIGIFWSNMPKFAL